MRYNRGNFHVNHALSMPEFMNFIRQFVRIRLQRSFTLQQLGPNEARIIFDAAVATAAAAFSFLFCTFLVPGFRLGGRATVVLAALPVVFVACNTVLGLYGRYRTSRSQQKALVLAGSVLLSLLVAVVAGGLWAPVLLWAALTIGPVVLARVLLNLPYTRHTNLRRVSVSHGGPVLVIGGAGYIGSHTVELLLRDGYRVRVLDRLMYGQGSLADFAGNDRFELLEGDASDVSKVTAAMQGASAVVHLAGLVGDPACAVDANFTRHANIVVTRMAKEVAQSLGVHRFVFASSCSVYGVSDQQATESDQVNPVSLYAQTKIDSERELLATGRDDFFVTLLRFATVFGHSSRPRFDLVVNLFVAQALTDGVITVVGPEQWRPFVHVRDVARSILLTLKAPTMLVQDQVFNVGDERLNARILQVAEVVRAAVNRHRNIEISVQDAPGDRRNYAVSFNKIHSMLNFQAETMLEDGVAEIVEHFLQGHYNNYRDEIYSNLATTQKQVTAFRDPEQLAHIYAPLFIK
jgi:nucleoside-diphosphate-sugar epimerase